VFGFDVGGKEGDACGVCSEWLVGAGGNRAVDRGGGGGGGGGSALVAHENIAQTVHVVDQKGKQAMLRRVVRNLPADHKTLVFLRMKTLCDQVSAEFKSAGQKCDALHGNREQVDRTAVVKAFKASTINLLFATDVAARGLDISDITHVVNFDFPIQRGAGGIEDYVYVQKDMLLHLLFLCVHMC
jgi:hypothetical protein